MAIGIEGAVGLGLKACASVVTAGLFLQPILAGRYFVGDERAIIMHGMLGEATAAVAILQALLAVGLAVRRRLRTGAAVALVAIAALVGIQVHLGHVGGLDLHIPLGATLLALSLVTTLWLWRDRAARIGVLR